MATPKKRNPQKAGRKTRYRPENATIAKALIMGGMTQEQAAEAMQVSEKTWYNWKNRHPEFLQAITNSDDEMVRIAEKSLLKRVTGYEWKEKQVSQEDGKDGVKKSQKLITRTQAPSDTAIMFLLTNRAPERWSRSPEASTQIVDAPVVPITLTVLPQVGDVKVTRGSAS